jgi:hypothetical protein
MPIKTTPIRITQPIRTGKQALPKGRALIGLKKSLAAIKKREIKEKRQAIAREARLARKKKALVKQTKGIALKAAIKKKTAIKQLKVNQARKAREAAARKRAPPIQPTKQLTKAQRRKLARQKRQAAAAAARAARGALKAGKQRAINNAVQVMSSSWVGPIGYDVDTQILVANLYGKWEAWRGVSPSEWALWLKAADACKTNDPTGRDRYWPGKSPSLGATWHYTMKPILDTKKRI